MLALIGSLPVEGYRETEFSSSSGSRRKRKKAQKGKNLKEGRQIGNGFSIPEQK